jgi:hypothetical protein
MTQKSDTRAVEARASRNSCGGCFRDPSSLIIDTPQAIPPLIALHIGEAFLAHMSEGGENV